MVLVRVDEEAGVCVCVCACVCTGDLEVHGVVAHTDLFDTHTHTHTHTHIHTNTHKAIWRCTGSWTTQTFSQTMKKKPDTTGETT